MDKVGNPHSGLALQALQFLGVDKTMFQPRPVENLVDAQARRQPLGQGVKRDGRGNEGVKLVFNRLKDFVRVSQWPDLDVRLEPDFLLLHHLHRHKIHAQWAVGMEFIRDIGGNNVTIPSGF